DFIICVGGKWLELPGDVAALLRENGIEIPVAGVALGKPGSESLLAAVLAIKQLPEQPVLMNELTGEVWVNESGLSNLLDRIMEGEFMPAKSYAVKEPEDNVYTNLTAA
ncbi:MAG: hypothetical protein NT094_05405, partial [Candidatus Staskawiczbacteria bacterium]|nr:hypothetical protein [Candidatus Staskawiczbacteria bacterium]